MSDGYYVDEFFMAKIAFQKGYAGIFVNETGPDKIIATPDEWIVDSCVVSDFASDYDIARLEKDEGDFYHLTSEHIELFSNQIKLASELTVNDLLKGLTDKMEYSNVYEIVIKKGKLKDYVQKHGKDIHHNGTHELINCAVGENGYYLNLDVGDDYQRPYFHVRVNSDNDLQVFDTFEEAYRNYIFRISEE